MGRKLPNPFKDPLNQTPGGIGLVEGDAIHNLIEVLKGGFGPNYDSDRAIFRFASLCGVTHNFRILHPGTRKSIPSACEERRC
jgi:hypothetical protein